MLLREQEVMAPQSLVRGLLPGEGRSHILLLAQDGGTATHHGREPCSSRPCSRGRRGSWEAPAQGRNEQRSCGKKVTPQRRPRTLKSWSSGYLVHQFRFHCRPSWASVGTPSPEPRTPLRERLPAEEGDSSQSLPG